MKWLSLEAVLATHKIQLELFGGAGGIRDAGMIESALARAQNNDAYEDASIGAGLLRRHDRLAAAYLFGFAKYHGFADGTNGLLFYPPICFCESISAAAGDVDEDCIAGWIAKHRRKLRRDR